MPSDKLPAQERLRRWKSKKAKLETKNAAVGSRVRPQDVSLTESKKPFDVLSKVAGKVMKSLVDAITDDDVDLVLAVWRRAMVAQKRQWNIDAHDWDYEPDLRTQLEATKLVAAYREGLPIQRQHVITQRFEDMTETLAKMQESPAASRVLGMMKSKEHEIDPLG